MVWNAQGIPDTGFRAGVRHFFFEVGFNCKPKCDSHFCYAYGDDKRAWKVLIHIWMYFFSIYSAVTIHTNVSATLTSPNGDARGSVGSKRQPPCVAAVTPLPKGRRRPGFPPQVVQDGPHPLGLGVGPAPRSAMRLAVSVVRPALLLVLGLVAVAATLTAAGEVAAQAGHGVWRAGVPAQSYRKGSGPSSSARVLGHRANQRRRLSSHPVPSVARLPVLTDRRRAAAQTLQSCPPPSPPLAAGRSRRVISPGCVARFGWWGCRVIFPQTKDEPLPSQKEFQLKEMISPKNHEKTEIISETVYQTKCAHELFWLLSRPARVPALF